jgi:hypothetical protein
MKNFLFTILISVLLIGSQSCGKDTDEFIPTNTTTVVKSDTSWQEDLLKINDMASALLPPLSIEKLMAELATTPTTHDYTTRQCNN